ncbi:MAG: adenylate/guanylate cyclase domain-containing protein [Xanthobacteraceae bacterium]
MLQFRSFLVLSLGKSWEVGAFMQPETRYAKSGDVHIAYQVFGEGPINLVLAPFFVSNVEHFWDEPDISRWLLRLASFARVVMFDKRGTGMSDRVAEMPGLDQRMDDLRAVMEAAGMEQAAILGLSEGGTLAALFAATYPNRCRALILCGAFARFSSWFPTEEAFQQFLGYVDKAWGSGGGLPFYIPSRVNDPAFQRWFARFERLGASPAAVMSYMRMNSQIDISDIVPTIQVPTLVIHRTQDVTINVEAGRYLAKHIPGARYLELPGSDHPPMIGDNADEIADAIQEFLTGSRAPAQVDRVLATVLFTDIVGSTEKAAALGDRRWRDLLDKHHATIRSNLARFRGHEVKTTGDGILATFDGPARGVRCACAIAEEIRPLGIEVRAGLHTGECEMMGDDVGGIAVHIGARVTSLAGAGEVLVSSTVRDLVAGSGLRFGDRGSQTLKGVPGDWHIYAVER